MSDQEEDTEILVENELLPKTQSAPSETNIKQKDKQEKKKGVFKFEWLNDFKFYIIYGRCCYMLNLHLLLIYINSFLFYSQFRAVMHMLKVFFQ